MQGSNLQYSSIGSDNGLMPWYQVDIWQVPGKYEHDWKYLTYTFAKSKFPVTEKLTNGALVTPTPDYW